MSLRLCTLTGVDEASCFYELIALSERFPFIEWGLLYSPRQQGVGRYPSIPFIKKALMALPKTVALAVHICGRGAPDLVRGENEVRELVKLAGERSGRVQLNFNISHGKVTAQELVACIERFNDVQFIAQYNRANEPVWPALSGLKNCSALFDSSGGRGILREGWPSPLIGTKSGYAGGLGPETLVAQLPLIEFAAGGTEYWIDMEASLRNADDHFSMATATICATIAEKFVN